MAHFSKIFHFSRSEVKLLYSKTKLKKKVLGLKLLQAPLSLLAPSENQECLSPVPQQQGKLLIVVPRSFGNACLRNRFRRQIKSIFYENKLYEYPFASILIAYRQAQDFSYQALKDFLFKVYDHQEPQAHE